MSCFCSFPEHKICDETDIFSVKVAFYSFFPGNAQMGVEGAIYLLLSWIVVFVRNVLFLVKFLDENTTSATTSHCAAEISRPQYFLEKGI
jgi:hypothetical protein